MSDLAGRYLQLSRRWKTAIIGAWVIALVGLIATGTGMFSPCNAFAQSSVCNVGDDETFTGPVTFQDEIHAGATPAAGTAGYVLTSQGSGAAAEWNASLVKYKASNTSRASTTAVSADPDLTFTPVAGKVYAFEFSLIISGNNAADFDFDFTLGGTCTIEMMVTTDPATPTFAYHDNSGETTLQIEATPQVFYGVGTLNCAGSSGAMSFDWAQNVSNGTATVLESGSWIRIMEVNGS